MSNEQSFDTGLGYSTIKDQPKANGAGSSEHSETNGIGRARRPPKHRAKTKVQMRSGLLTICAADVKPKRWMPFGRTVRGAFVSRA